MLDVDLSPHIEITRTPKLNAAIAVTLILFPTSQRYAADPVVVVSEAIVSGAKQPRVAVDRTGTIFVAFGADKDIYVRKSVDGAKTDSTPIRVAPVTGLVLGMRRGPRIVAGNVGVVITAISGNR